MLQDEIQVLESWWQDSLRTHAAEHMEASMVASAPDGCPLCLDAVDDGSLAELMAGFGLAVTSSWEGLTPEDALRMRDVLAVVARRFESAVSRLRRRPSPISRVLHGRVSAYAGAVLETEACVARGSISEDFTEAEFEEQVLETRDALHYSMIALQKARIDTPKTISVQVEALDALFRTILPQVVGALRDGAPRPAWHLRATSVQMWWRQITREP
jgi:hypothetical protein